MEVRSSALVAVLAVRASSSSMASTGFMSPRTLRTVSSLCPRSSKPSVRRGSPVTTVLAKANTPNQVEAALLEQTQELQNILGC